MTELSDFAYMASLVLVFLMCAGIVLHPGIEDTLLERLALTFLAVSVFAEAVVKVHDISSQAPVRGMVMSAGLLSMSLLMRKLRW